MCFPCFGGRDLKDLARFRFSEPRKKETKAAWRKAKIKEKRKRKEERTRRR
jgi:hypothetical protein